MTPSPQRPSSRPSPSRPSSRPGDRPIAHWRFWIPLLFQVLLVLLIPAQSLYAHAVGTPVILQTVPVDPYNLFQGYYVTLRYDISLTDTLKTLPGWDAVEAQVEQDPDNTQLYVVLRQPAATPSEDTDAAGTPLAWEPIRVATIRPENLPDDQIAIRGTYQGTQIRYGLEQYFIPEDQRDEINDRIRRAQQTGDRPAYVVEVKVTGRGTSTPVSLWVDGVNYQF
jgi:uncharacterized membrane-anchored protein